MLDADGNALSGVLVSWNAANGSSVFGRTADTTNIAGRAAAEWTLALTEGEQSVSIRAGELDPITVTATATQFHAASVTVGGGFACALTGSGRAFCWGRNNYGQLGTGAVGDSTLVPTPVAGDIVFTVLTAGGAHACGLTADGTAYCWGYNENGETGTGTTGSSVPAPTPVQTALRFTQISAEGLGEFSGSTCGLTAAGEAWCWGDNMFGKLGDGTTTNSAVPVRVQSDVPFSFIQTGYFHSCAVATTGELWCWGEQESDPGAFGARPAGLYLTPVALHEGFQFTRLSTGRNFTCGLNAEHTAFCWGADSEGGLGNGEVESSAVPLPVAGGHSYATISSASHEETIALTTGAELYRWGSPGNDVPQTTPVRVTELPFFDMDSGELPFDNLNGACGRLVDTAVYCVRDDGVVRGVLAPVTP